MKMEMKMILSLQDTLEYSSVLATKKVGRENSPLAPVADSLRLGVATPAFSVEWLMPRVFKYFRENGLACYHKSSINVHKTIIAITVFGSSLITIESRIMAEIVDKIIKASCSTIS
jgi:hypothetical protein